MALGDYKVAAELRDVIARIARKVQREEHPRPTYGVIKDFDRTALTAKVLFPGSEDLISVKMGAMQPAGLNQKVRVSPVAGDLFLEDVIGPCYVDFSSFEEPWVKPEIDLGGAVMVVAPFALTLGQVEDETATPLTVGLKVTFRMPFAGTLTGATASLTTASSSGNVVFDVRRNGVSVFSATPTLAAGAESTIGTAGTPTVSTPTLHQNDEITLHVVSAGTGAVGGKLVLIGNRISSTVTVDEGNFEDAVLALAIPHTYLDTDTALTANSDTKIATQKATKTYADTKVPSNFIDTDGTLAANSDTKLATQKATKTYADTKVPLSYLDADTSLSADSDTKVATQKATKAYVDAHSGGGGGTFDEGQAVLLAQVFGP